MVDLDVGTICLGDVSLSPALTLEAFRRDFPKERITGAWPARQGAKCRVVAYSSTQVLAGT